MKVFLFYRSNSEREQEVIEYLREFERRTGKQLPTMDVDSREGTDMCKLYDIVQYPIILAIDDSGRELQRWGDNGMLPRIGEVSYYVQQN